MNAYQPKQASKLERRPNNKQSYYKKMICNGCHGNIIFFYNNLVDVQKFYNSFFFTMKLNPSLRCFNWIFFKYFPPFLFFIFTFLKNDWTLKTLLLFKFIAYEILILFIYYVLCIMYSMCYPIEKQCVHDYGNGTKSEKFLYLIVSLFNFFYATYIAKASSFQIFYTWLYS